MWDVGGGEGGGERDHAEWGEAQQANALETQPPHSCLQWHGPRGRLRFQCGVIYRTLSDRGSDFCCWGVARTAAGPPRRLASDGASLASVAGCGQTSLEARTATVLDQTNFEN